MPLAASLHGPGTPGVSTSRSPDIARARSTSIYSAMGHSLLRGVRGGRRLSTPAGRRAGDGRAFESSLSQKSAQKEKPPKAWSLPRAQAASRGSLIADHHLRRTRQRERQIHKRIERMKAVRHLNAYHLSRRVIARRARALVGRGLGIPAGGNVDRAGLQTLRLVAHEGLDNVGGGRRSALG